MMAPARTTRILALMALFAATASPAATREWNFDVSLDGKPIGEHRFTLHELGDIRELDRRLTSVGREASVCVSRSVRKAAAVGGELIAQPCHGTRGFGRTRRHALLHEGKHRGRPRLTRTLVPGAPDGSRRQRAEQDEYDNAGVEQPDTAGTDGR